LSPENDPSAACIYNRMITIFLRRTNGKGEKMQVVPKTTTQDLLTDIRRALHC
jgi:hypothetical protein